jgi:hypothetical protein
MVSVLAMRPDFSEIYSQFILAQKLISSLMQKAFACEAPCADVCLENQNVASHT